MRRLSAAFAAGRSGVPLLAGSLGALIFAGLWSADPAGVATIVRERAIDAIQLSFPRMGDRARVLVVDIDDRTLAKFGGWPLPRKDLARLVSTIVDARPSVVALDIFFPGPDRRSAKSLGDEVSRLSENDEMKRIVADLPDTDKDFADVLARGPTVLGALAAEGGDAAEMNPIRVEGEIGDETAAPVGGVAAPYETLASGALGLGVASLFGEEGGIVRKAPLLVSTGERLAPGLALEAARIAGGVAMLGVTVEKTLALGPRQISLREGGALRIRWSDPALWAARTISAIDVFEGRVAAERLSGAAALIGTSAPEAAALRPSPMGPLTPTVQIQAEAVQQLLDGIVPHRPDGAPRLEIGAILLLGVVAATIATLFGPAATIAILAIFAAFWFALAAAALVQQQIVVDPIGPPLAVFVAGNAAGAASFARTRRLKALISRRFEQYLATDVVREIIAHPDRLRREGEMREVTALFTDIEDFTPMTQRVEPRELIALLDIYLENLCRLVTRHGGMVDGIVGDAIHAFFNVPLERAGHADAAVDCAIAIIGFSEAFRHEPRAAAAGFGRTRIGVETGPAIVGDVGGQQRLNYTAYGDAVIVAARLEPANKLFNSSICIGPGAAAAVTERRLTPLGEIRLKGMAKETAVFTVDDATVTEPTRELPLSGAPPIS